MSSAGSFTSRLSDPVVATSPCDRADGLAVAALTLIALVLRLSQLHQSLVGDEVLAYNEVVGHSLGQALHLVRTGPESSPPLFFVLAWLSAKVGDPTVWIRLPSVLLGAATVPVVFAIGRLTVGRVAGLIGAGVLALAPFAVYYGVEARPYATMTFFVALSTLALLRAVDTRAWAWWVLYALSAAAAAYSHYTCVFVLGAQAVWSVWASRDRPGQPLVANAAVVLVYLPWIPELHGRDLSVYATLYPLGVRRVLTDVLRPIPGHPSAPLRAIPTFAGLAVIVVCALAGAFAVARHLRAQPAQRRRLPEGLPLLVALALATPVGVLLYSLLGTDIWLPRNLSASMPATALVLGALLAALPRPLAALSAGAVAIVLVAGTLRSFDPAYARGPFRAIAAYLDRVAGPRDPVTIVSLVGAPAIPAQFDKPHLLLSSARLWRSAAPGSTGFVVLDDTIARILKIRTPRAPGFRLIASRHYAGSFPTDVLVYRPVRSGR